MSIEELPIFGGYDKEVYTQFNPEDCANWYLLENPKAKKKMAMYPAMGRRHINYLGDNKLIFSQEPRMIEKSVKYVYICVGSEIYRVDSNFNAVNISQGMVTTLTGNMFFDFLVAGTITFSCFVDGSHIYVYREDTGQFYVLSGTGVPENPTCIVSFGNRIAVSNRDSSQFNLSIVDLGGGSFSATACFDPATFAQENGIIRQFAVLQNTLYIFTDYNTGIWANIQSVLPGGTTFPWKKNTTYDWNFGIVDPKSVDVDFNVMAWLAQNKSGLFQVMMSSGQSPEQISTRAIDALFQRDAVNNIPSPFMTGNSLGFLYEYNDTIFYRISAGDYDNNQLLGDVNNSYSIEYNFDTKKWSRCIELNSERNRIQRHVYFNYRHLVTLQGEGTVYEMSGQFFTNEVENPDQPDHEAIDAYISYPFRYERTTPIFSLPDYAEFETKYVEIDFVWGYGYVKTENPFEGTTYIVTEESTDDNPVFVVDESSTTDNPVFLITEESNIVNASSNTYRELFKPHIELYWSDDGGVSFEPADVLEFSQIGYYQWRMRWYQLGCSRNRVYKLVCVSGTPIVILGAVMEIERVSGGAN